MNFCHEMQRQKSVPRRTRRDGGAGRPENGWREADGGSGAGEFEPQDREGIHERVGRVADHQDGAVAEHAEDGLQETRLGVWIEMCGGFVEEQDGAAAEEFACEREAEVFAGGEIAGGFGEHGVEAVGEHADEGIGSGFGEGGADGIKEG